MNQRKEKKVHRQKKIDNDDGHWPIVWTNRNMSAATPPILFDGMRRME